MALVAWVMVASMATTAEDFVVQLRLEPALCFHPLLRWLAYGATRAETAAWFALKLHFLLSAGLRLRFYDRLALALHRSVLLEVEVDVLFLKRTVTASMHVVRGMEAITTS